MINETELTIRYADTDRMGVVHHSVYACYCEIGRIELCKQLGLPYHHLEEEGIYLMVAEQNGRFKAPIRFEDAVVVRTWIAKLSRRFVQFSYELVRQPEGKTLYTGFTKHLFTKQTEGTVRVAEHHFGKFEAAYVRSGSKSEPRRGE